MGAQSVSGVFSLMAVAAGAMMGALMRWGISLTLNSRWDMMPLGTLVCNLTGALVIGLVTGWMTVTPSVSPAVRCFLVTGLLGSLTTFSTFSLEAVTLIESGRLFAALTHSALHLGGSLLMTTAGVILTRTYFAGS